MLKHEKMTSSFSGADEAPAAREAPVGGPRAARGSGCSLQCAVRQSLGTDSKSPTQSSEGPFEGVRYRRAAARRMTELTVVKQECQAWVQDLLQSKHI
jgi:hypothetical protein